MSNAKFTENSYKICLQKQHLLLNLCTLHKTHQSNDWYYFSKFII